MFPSKKELEEMKKETEKLKNQVEHLANFAVGLQEEIRELQKPKAPEYFG